MMPNSSKDAPGFRRLGRSALLVALALAGLLIPAAASGGTAIVTATTNYYTATGTNWAEIRQSMLQARPWKGTSFAYDARTDWHIRSQFSFREEAGQQRLDGFQIKTTVKITLPSWIPPAGHDPVVAQGWARFFKALSTHEQGHLQIARLATVEIQRRLSALPTFNSPQELDTVARQTIATAIEEFKKKEEEYDTLTRHGVTQGAFFPHGRVMSTPTSAVPAKQF